MNETWGSVGPAGSTRFGSARARIHHHLILPAEGIRQRGSRLQVPAAIEDLAGDIDRAPSDPCRLEVADRQSYAIRDPARNEGLIPGERLVRDHRVGPACRRGGVGVRGCHEQVVRGETGSVVDQARGFVVNVARDSDVVANREREPGLTVVKRQATHVELVVNLRCELLDEPAHDRLAEWRRDVARRGAGLEDARGRWGFNRLFRRLGHGQRGFAKHHEHAQRYEAEGSRERSERPGIHRTRTPEATHG